MTNSLPPEDKAEVVDRMTVEGVLVNRIVRAILKQWGGMSEQRRLTAKERSMSGNPHPYSSYERSCHSAAAFEQCGCAQRWREAREAEEEIVPFFDERTEWPPFPERGNRDAYEVLISAKDHRSLLTQSEVDALPVGSRVAIWWSGGNGPAFYTIEANRLGHAYYQDEPYADPITFVGRERYHTRVALADKPPYLT